ncbi:MAG: ABC transporter ATP-binding protein [Deltaproteobacteria bacterium]|nr:MAG: ABC transporter ATP-binding protein [Deltaproteobacteria bacterium]
MIRIEGVEKWYGGFQALHRLDLHVRPGEVFGFLGPNGAGKTTTIRMLSGVLSPTRGRIRIDGIDLARHPVESKRRVGYIPDRPYLYDKLTAWEFLRFVAGMYGVPAETWRQRARELLAEHDLLHRADELVEAYSHGMKQRLVLSAALLHDPRALIVDEPMVGLDPHGARRIKERFRQIAAEGRTVFLSTHSLDVAQEVCDRVGILYGGRLVALGTMDELVGGDRGADLEEVFMTITEEESNAAGLPLTGPQGAGDS